MANDSMEMDMDDPCFYNSSVLELSNDFDLVDSYRVAMGCVIFLASLPFILLDYRAFPVGALVGTLLGALLMVIFQVVKQDEVYSIVGSPTSIRAIFLVFGILIITYFFAREDLLTKILRQVLKPYLKFENYLLRVCVLSYLLSTLFTSDVCCFVMTPILLKLWETQERHQVELKTLLLAVMTSSNIGAMVMIFSSLPMALISAKTSSWEQKHSRLDMRSSVMYMLPVSAVVFLVNTGFLVAHYKLHHRKTTKTKLVSEASRSSQEMGGLAGRSGTGQNQRGSPHNGMVHGNRMYDGVYIGPEGIQRSDDLISVPCQLETILEDEILEISSCQSTSVRDCFDLESPSSRRQQDHGYHSEATTLDSDSSSSDSDDEQVRMCNTDENLHQLAMNYRPSALQSQNLTVGGNSDSSLSQPFDKHAFELSHKWGVYRSLSAFSLHGFLPASAGDGGDSVNSPGDSLVFLVTLCLLMVTVISLLLASCYTIKLELGFVTLAAAIFAIVSDVVLNRRPAVLLVKQADWSLVLMLMGLQVWVQGLNNTHVLRYAWDSLGLRAGSYGTAHPITIAALGVFVIFGTNVIGAAPTVLLVVDLLEPCARQQGVVLYTAIFAVLGGNLMLYGSVSNIIVLQKGMQVLKRRLTFVSHLKFGVVATIVNIVVGVLVVYALLLIGI